MTAVSYDVWLWWGMLATAVTGAALSLLSSLFDRRGTVWPTPRQRFLLHVIGYVFTTLSILAFVLRGLIAPA